jgi:hypothetical protein
MSVSLKVESELMGLPLVERAMLAERLLSSFDSSEQASLEVEWGKEVGLGLRFSSNQIATDFLTPLVNNGRFDSPMLH